MRRPGTPSGRKMPWFLQSEMEQQGNNVSEQHTLHLQLRALLSTQMLRKTKVAYIYKASPTAIFQSIPSKTYDGMVQVSGLTAVIW